MDRRPVATRHKFPVYHVSISSFYFAAKESSLPSIPPDLGPDLDHDHDVALSLTCCYVFHLHGCAARVWSLHHEAFAPELDAEAPVRNLHRGACAPELVGEAPVRNLRRVACAPETVAAVMDRCHRYTCPGHPGRFVLRCVQGFAAVLGAEDSVSGTHVSAASLQPSEITLTWPDRKPLCQRRSVPRGSAYSRVSAMFSHQRIHNTPFCEDLRLRNSVPERSKTPFIFMVQWGWKTLC